ncbi:hypothetical protein FGO68_gene1778 [Halteria grandinella]|uniref:Major facilitator superfamily protein n=1 Tax=Halteria grandinella TaxID=5974 RepID=A0A8J8NRI2_HALGN|nr:hypothetical protein FGO68_gene1778 [Halteria grandinella]
MNLLSPITNSYITQLAVQSNRTIAELCNKGNIFGYVGLVPLLLTVFGIFLSFNYDQLFQSKIVLVIMGGYMFCLFTVALILMKNFKISNDNQDKISVTQGVVRLFRGLQHLKSLKQLRIFLIAQVFINDALATTGSTLNIIAFSELGIKPIQQLYSTIEFVSISIISNSVCLMLTNKYPNKIFAGLISCLCFYASTALYSFFFYDNEVQYYIVVGFLAICIGSTQSLTKAVVSEYSPSGYETTYFSMQSLTGGLTTWICPLLSGLINDHYGSYKPALLFVIFPFFVIGIIILAFFNSDLAQEEKMQLETKNHETHKLSDEEEITQIEN